MIKMGLIDLFFSGGLNSNFWYFIFSLTIAILLTLADRFLFGILPNFLIGIAYLISLIFFILWIGENFIKNLWKTPTGMAIVIAVSFIILALIITSSFSKRQSSITQVSSVINPSKIGKGIKRINR